MPAPIVTAHQLARLLLAEPDGKIEVEVDVNHTEGTACVSIAVEGGSEGWTLLDEGNEPEVEDT